MFKISPENIFEMQRKMFKKSEFKKLRFLHFSFYLLNIKQIKMFQRKMQLKLNEKLLHLVTFCKLKLEKMRTLELKKENASHLSVLN